jgi:hypothetical protein
MRQPLTLLLFLAASVSCRADKPVAGSNPSGRHDAATTDAATTDAGTTIDSTLADAGIDVTGDEARPVAVDAGTDGGANPTDAATVPACDPSNGIPIEATGYVRDGDGNLISTSVDTPVIVISFNEAQITPPLASAGIAGRRVVVESVVEPVTRWALELLIPGLPANQLTRGDILRMVVTANPAGAFAPHTISQTLVLTRDGAIVLFTSNMWDGATSIPAAAEVPSTLTFDLLPDLGRWGLDLRDAGPSCVVHMPVDVCPQLRRAVTATWAGQSDRALGGATLALGSLSLSVGRLDQFLSDGACDAFSNTRLAGFVAPAPVQPGGGS